MESDLQDFRNLLLKLCKDICGYRCQELRRRRIIQRTTHFGTYPNQHFEGFGKHSRKLFPHGEAGHESQSEIEHLQR